MVNKLRQYQIEFHFKNAKRLHDTYVEHKTY